MIPRWTIVYLMGTIMVINLLLIKLVDSKSTTTRGTKKALIRKHSQNLTVTAKSLRIVGGMEAFHGSVPYQVVLKGSVHGNLICSGSLLSEYWVVTAAHCLAKLNSPVDIVVLAGVHNLKKPDPKFLQQGLVKKMIIHGKYKGVIDGYDIALLELKQAMKLGRNSRVTPIRWAEPDFVPTNPTATLSGWGRIVDGGPFSDILKITKLPIVEDKTCAKVYPPSSPHFRMNPEIMICAGGLFAQSGCHGDSGGPLVLKERDGVETLVGIVSGGALCGQEGIPAVFTKVSAFHEWIDEHIGVEELKGEAFSLDKGGGSDGVNKQKFPHHRPHKYKSFKREKNTWVIKF